MLLRNKEVRRALAASALLACAAVGVLFLALPSALPDLGSENLAGCAASPRDRRRRVCSAHRPVPHRHAACATADFRRAVVSSPRPNALRRPYHRVSIDGGRPTRHPRVRAGQSRMPPQPHRRRARAREARALRLAHRHIASAQDAAHLDSAVAGAHPHARRRDAGDRRHSAARPPRAEPPRHAWKTSSPRSSSLPASTPVPYGSSMRPSMRPSSSAGRSSPSRSPRHRRCRLRAPCAGGRGLQGGPRVERRGAR